MSDKRTNIDWSRHEVLETITPECKIWWLKKPGTMIDNIKYINAGGVLAVTGDYGNWIFCREFHPDPTGGVSGGYWDEKLVILSTQQPMEFDAEATEAEIRRMLDGGLEEDGYEGDRLEKMREYLQESLEQLNDGEFSYTAYAYRGNPGFLDMESIIHKKKRRYWLNAVYDGFDELCRRCKDQDGLTKSDLQILKHYRDGYGLSGSEGLHENLVSLEFLGPDLRLTDKGRKFIADYKQWNSLMAKHKYSRKDVVKILHAAGYGWPDIVAVTGLLRQEVQGIIDRSDKLPAPGIKDHAELVVVATVLYSVVANYEKRELEWFKKEIKMKKKIKRMKRKLKKSRR